MNGARHANARVDDKTMTLESAIGVVLAAWRRPSFDMSSDCTRNDKCAGVASHCRCSTPCCATLSNDLQFVPVEMSSIAVAPLAIGSTLSG